MKHNWTLLPSETGNWQDCKWKCYQCDTIVTDKEKSAASMWCPSRDREIIALGWEMKDWIDWLLEWTERKRFNHKKLFAIKNIISNRDKEQPIPAEKFLTIVKIMCDKEMIDEDI